MSGCTGCAHIIDELEELGDIVGDTRGVGVHPLQVLLVDLAHTLQMKFQLITADKALENIHFPHPCQIY